MKNNKLRFWFLACIFTFLLSCLPAGRLPFTFLYGQEADKLVTLSKQIIEAKGNQGLYAPFSELKEIYLKDNKYAEFAEFLRSLAQKKKALEPFTDYYIALTRYQQLKYLEEKQSWDEYFSQGNTYRDELTQSLQKTLDSTTKSDTLNLYSRFLLWQFHKDQQDVFSEDALSELMVSALEYSKNNQDTEPIKEVADKLLSYGEKAKSRELYKIYADKISTSDIKDDMLVGIASGFYKEKNLELSETIYDVYIDRVTKSLPQEKLIPVLIDITKLFSWGEQEQNDAVYAEKIFAKIEALAGKEAFNEELIYLRAFNLEKTKEYSKAKDNYADLVLRYPATTHSDEAVFKMGMIHTYILRDKKTGMGYFEQLAQKGTISPQAISSLYQLGLLSQWEDDGPKSKEYYNKLIEKAADNFPETVTLARERLEEIDEGKPIEYNLETFLDVSLKEENALFDMTKVDLKSQPYRIKKGGEVNINSSPYIAQSGCMQVELQYLWSGHTGTKKPAVGEAAFNTAYTEPGTKEVNLVVVSPAGIVDRSMDLLDQYN